MATNPTRTDNLPLFVGAIASEQALSSDHTESKSEISAPSGARLMKKDDRMAVTKIKSVLPQKVEEPVEAKVLLVRCAYNILYSTVYPYHLSVLGGGVLRPLPNEGSAADQPRSYWSESAVSLPKIPKYDHEPKTACLTVPRPLFLAIFVFVTPRYFHLPRQKRTVPIPILSSPLPTRGRKIRFNPSVSGDLSSSC